MHGFHGLKFTSNLNLGNIFEKKINWISFMIGFRGYILIKSKWFQSSKSLELPVFSSLLPTRVLSCTHKGASVGPPPPTSHTDTQTHLKPAAEIVLPKRYLDASLPLLE